MSKRKVIAQGRKIRQNRALGDLVSKLPEYLFEAYRNDASFTVSLGAQQSRATITLNFLKKQ